MPARVRAGFVPAMLLLRTERLPQGNEWSYELKYDGYRAISFKTDLGVHVRSRNENDFTATYPAVAKALADLPPETVIDGEVVAFDDDGRPSFNILQYLGTRPATRSPSSSSTF